jgi:hypothetical protein
VSLAAVPVIISYARSHRATQSQEVRQQQVSPDKSQGQQSEQTRQSSPRPHMSFGEAMLRLSLIGLISPFYDLASNPLGGLIGLVILAVGIRIAWRLCGGSETAIYGPFENTAAAPAST